MRVKIWIPFILLNVGMPATLVERASAAGPPETISAGDFQLEWTGTINEKDESPARIKLQTSRGDIQAKYYSATVNGAPTRRGVVWVGGAGSEREPEGPSTTIYPAVCEQLQKKGIASLRVEYRRPGFVTHCVLDTLCGIAFLHRERIDCIVLAGHSFGGAVVISAGAVSPIVRAIVPMSSQTEGTEFAPRVSPRKMLLIHGTADQVLPFSCSEEIYARAREPKELRLFKGAGHNLDESRQEIIDFLADWIPRVGLNDQ